MNLVLIVLLILILCGGLGGGAFEIHPYGGQNYNIAYVVLIVLLVVLLFRGI